MKKFNKKTICDNIKQFCMLALNAYYKMRMNNFNLSSDDISPCEEYYNTVKEIMATHHCGSYKEDMIKALKPNANSAYYEIVIDIVNGYDLPSNKIKTIKLLSVKE